MPNVSVSGIDVSGLTAQEVNETVARARQELGGAASVRLSYQSWSGVLYGDQFQTADEDAGAAAVAVGREHFLTQGFQYLRHLAGGGDEAVTGSGDVPQEQPELDRVLADLGAQMGFSANQASYEVKGLMLEENAHVELLGAGEVQWFAEEDCTVFNLPENLPKQAAYTLKIHR